MKLQSKSYILRGAIAGLIVGNVVARMSFNKVDVTGMGYFTTLDVRSAVVILASIGAGAFFGHVLRHQGVEKDATKMKNSEDV